MYDKKSLLISPLFVLASSCGSTLLLANETAIQSTLNEELQQTTVIATQNNQNIDYQPFILSVWEQEQLTAFGVKTLKDALLLMPGIDMIGDTMNNRTPVGYHDREHPQANRYCESDHFRDLGIRRD